MKKKTPKRTDKTRRKAVTRVTPPTSYFKDCAELREEMTRLRDSQWSLGDRILKIRKEYEIATGNVLTDKQLAIDAKVSRSQIVQLRQVAEYYPPDKRGDAPWSVYREARIANEKLPKDRRKEVEDIVSLIKDGEHTCRNITAAFEEEREQYYAEQRAKEQEAVWRPKLDGIANQPHLAAWEEIVKQLPDGCLDVVWADPPFAGVYARYSKSSRITPTSTKLLIQADNVDKDAALKTTLRLFDLLPAKMRAANGDSGPGVLFLHQHGGRVHDPRIIRYAERRGWTWHCPAIWVKAKDPTKKGSIPPQEMDKISASVTQNILIATYGDVPPKLIGHQYIGNLAYHASTSLRLAGEVGRGKASRHDGHMFQHPPELAEELIGRVLPHQSRGLVFEPFGCTGPASVAAIRCGWDWIYTESYQENFELGKRKISAAIAAQSSDDAATG